MGLLKETNLIWDKINQHILQEQTETIKGFLKKYYM